jgi:hypothetical protein
VLDGSDRWDERWLDLQVRFVDDPHRSVSQADELVAEVLDDIVARLRQERSQLEDGWHAGVEPSTEELRQTLQSYRSLFERLRAF